MTRLFKLRDITIYKDTQYYCGPGPSSVLLPDGRILVAFRRARDWTSEGVIAHGFPSTDACLTCSDDEGCSWSKPVVFTAGNITNQNLLRLPNGVLLCLTQRGELVPLKVYEKWKDQKPFHYNEAFGWAHASFGVQVMRSFDDGLPWEGPFFISPVPDIDPIFPDWPSPSGLRASPITLQDGAVGVAVYGLRGGKRKSGNVWFMTSTDFGETWIPRGRIADDPDGTHYPNETSVYQCESGKLVAFMRIENTSERLLCTSESHDSGVNWSPWQPQNIKGHPFQAARLSTGQVLLAYGYRHTPMGVRACLLDANCDNLDTTQELILRDDGGSFDLGYPHVLPLPGGKALITYYHNVDNGLRFVTGSLVEVK